MALSPTDVLEAILADPTNPGNVRKHTTPDVTYVSLNFEDADLHRVMPWAGTQRGPDAIVKTFVDVRRFWISEAFEPGPVFGSGEHAAVFGRMTYRSAVLGNRVTSPFAVYVRVVDGKCVYMQFMEDTFATARSFREDGEWTIRSDPDGEAITI